MRPNRVRVVVPGGQHLQAVEDRPAHPFMLSTVPFSGITSLVAMARGNNRISLTPPSLRRPLRLVLDAPRHGPRRRRGRYRPPPRSRARR